MEGISYPVAIKDIDKRVTMNNILIHVLVLEDNKTVFPLNIGKKVESNNHVNLLFIAADEGNNHYVLIKNKVN